MVIYRITFIRLPGWQYFTTGDVVTAQTAAFVTWLIGHILLALNLKQDRLPLLKQGLFTNRFGAMWLAGMIVLVFTITSVPALHQIFYNGATSDSLGSDNPGSDSIYVLDRGEEVADAAADVITGCRYPAGPTYCSC
ncbi:cation-translocating P-type ATPase C-terminal domain-containing protein [Methanocella sp. MCL-LM]|uniref:cation-translocating P-type ATPase C-terminal domain-containing protein n=1 Tax=Methanocella sp. MCL-LM TaxID=3412035 RepID=UPI003C775A80